MNYKYIFKAVAVSAVAVVFSIGCDDEGGDGGGNTVDPNNHNNGGNPSVTTFQDSRDGKTYKTVKVGGNTWMAENLNRATAKSKCYGNDTSNCAKYGRLYNWADAKSACPSGFHLPSNDEWTALENAIGGGSTVGTKLKSAAGWDEGGNGTNDLGFSALPGGYGSSGGDFNDAGYSGFWWSATEWDAGYAWYRLIYCNYGGSLGRHDDGKASLFSVRCVAD
jgi:uncharacterized protein (TIGR02145 family)